MEKKKEELNKKENYLLLWPTAETTFDRKKTRKGIRMRILTYMIGRSQVCLYHETHDQEHTAVHIAS